MTICGAAVVLWQRWGDSTTWLDWSLAVMAGSQQRTEESPDSSNRTTHTQTHSHCGAYFLELPSNSQSIPSPACHSNRMESDNSSPLWSVWKTADSPLCFCPVYFLYLAGRKRSQASQLPVQEELSARPLVDQESLWKEGGRHDRQGRWEQYSEQTRDLRLSCSWWSESRTEPCTLCQEHRSTCGGTSRSPSRERKTQ